MGLPFRSGHLLAPTLVWLIADPSATFDWVDLGDIGPAPTPGELGEFRIPQRGIFAIGRALFDPRPSRQQEDQVTIRPRRPNEPESHGARRREMVRAEGLPQLRMGTDVFCEAVHVGPSARAVGVDFTHEQIAKAARVRDRDGFPQITSSKPTSISCRSTTRCLTP
jgi:hypothetical protein